MEKAKESLPSARLEYSQGHLDFYINRQKNLAVFLYCHGVSMNALAKMFQVQTSSILKWIRKFAKEHYEKPVPKGKAIVMELDEMWHYVKKTAETPDVESYG